MTAVVNLIQFDFKKMEKEKSQPQLLSPPPNSVMALLYRILNQLQLSLFLQ